MAGGWVREESKGKESEVGNGQLQQEKKRSAPGSGSGTAHWSHREEIYPSAQSDFHSVTVSAAHSSRETQK